MTTKLKYGNWNKEDSVGQSLAMRETLKLSNSTKKETTSQREVMINLLWFGWAILIESSTTLEEVMKQISKKKLMAPEFSLCSKATNCHLIRTITIIWIIKKKKNLNRIFQLSRLNLMYKILYLENCIINVLWTWKDCQPALNCDKKSWFHGQKRHRTWKSYWCSREQRKSW